MSRVHFIGLTIRQRRGQSASAVARRLDMKQRQVAAGRLALARRLAEDLRDKLVEEAPKQSGEFSEGIQVRQPVRNKGGHWDQFEIHSTAIVGDGLSLWNLITKGTSPHEIPTGGAAAQLAKGYPLSFYWENGPNGAGLYHFWSVQHPGTAANPFPDRALHRWRPDAQRQFREFGLEIVRAGTGVRRR